MKRDILRMWSVGAMCIIAICILAACAKPAQESTTDAAKSAFKLRFPNADAIVWNSRLGYCVASFVDEADCGVNNGASDEANERPRVKWVAWFDGRGELYLTERECDYEELPTNIKEALAECKEFSNLCILDAAHLQPSGSESEYALLVEGRVYGIEQRASLYYRSDGVLHISIVEPMEGYTYGDYLLWPLCRP